jgi:glutamate formiminotransferase
VTELIECVPNFSEGKDEKTIEEITSPFKNTEGVNLLDVKYDADTNRTVVTVVGNKKGLKKSILEMFEKATELIDMTKHKGEHPRMGAVDVVPFIPIKNTSMEDCVELSKEVGKEVAKKFNIPIFLYEDSATTPERKNLANIRRGEYEGMFEKIKEKEWKPDYGPQEMNEKSGATAIGARPFLIAYNINLDTKDVSIGNKIAGSVRNSGGGLRYVKGGAWYLEERDIVQVTFNMTNFEGTPLFRLYEMVKNEASRYGVNILGSEIFGMTPAKALYDTAKFYLGLHEFEYEQIIEEKLTQL